MNIINKGLEVLKGLTKETPVNVADSQGKKATTYPEAVQKFRTREDIRKLENAIDLSENISNYNREDLHRIYRRILNDPM